MAKVLEDHGFIVQVHFIKEVAKGQHMKLIINYSLAINAADQALTAKWII